ncbi:MAG: adenylate kinase [Candidatus Xenobiia bacterium LiM19]
MFLVLLGMPGSGKGTQAQFIKESYGVPHISTGDIFREAIKTQTPLGQKAKSYLDRGELVPDELVTDIVKERIEREDCTKGFILDGYPRTVNQAEALDSIMREMGIRLNVVIDFTIPAEEAVKRLSSRRSCSSCGIVYNLLHKPPCEEGKCDVCGGLLYQRDDDKDDVIRNRLKVYELQTAPIIEYYEKQNNIAHIDAEAQIVSIRDRIKELLGNKATK